MRVIALLLCSQMLIWAIQYNVTSASNRRSNNAYTQEFEPQVTPKKTYGTNSSRSSSQSTNIKVQSAPSVQSRNVQLPVRVTPAPTYSTSSTPRASVSTQVSRSSSQEMQRIYGSPSPSNTPSNLGVQVVPPSTQSQSTQAPQSVDVRVYPATIGNQSKTPEHHLKVDVGKSRPITQDMMFYPAPMQKMQIPVRKKPQVQVSQPAPQPVYQDEYDDEDSAPLFIRNRNGVMLGAGIGGAFNRLWVGGSDGNEKFYSNNFTYYFRLGYQHYFTPYLGLRSYVHLGDWSYEINTRANIGGRDVEIASVSNLNYSGYVELLYDFVVLENHSFGIFGGFGIGVGSYEFSNDGTESLKDYFAMPMISAGFAYTLYLNNRFEFEVKAPLRQGVIETSWRSEFSTWMIGFSYTYVF